MLVFVSSVRRGLEEARDSLAGQIRALGHEPVFFEDFTAQSVPSREACLKAAESADVYILLLGPHYGTVFPETGTSPTHDEYTVAVRRGIPRVVMHKLGAVFDPEQEEFANQVEKYTTGLFRREFSTAAELLVEVTRVLREIEAAPSTAAALRDLCSIPAGQGCVPAEVITSRCAISAAQGVGAAL